MDYQDDLTNENITKRFKSQFELVGYAIKLAENMIKTGRGPLIKTETQNTAMQVLDEIEAGVDRFEDIPEKKPVQDFSSERHSDPKDSFKGDAPKSVERKRARKILVE